MVVAASCGGAATGTATTSQARVVVEGTEGGTAWLGGAIQQSRVLVGSDGQLYIGLWIDAPQTVGVAQRAPMDVALVVDTSGSMSGEKIDHARMAAMSFIESLTDGDIVSLYAFSNYVMELAPPTPVGPGTRAALAQRVQTLQAAGGTNMFDGMRVGLERVAAAPQTHPVRRVVLISDGRANIGPSTPEELGNLAAQGSEWGTQVTAIGIGLDYDETTLAAMAVRSAGRVYHLADTSQMAQILRAELELLATTVATNAVIEIAPSDGVQILGVEGVPAQIDGGRARVSLGSLHGGQHREILVRARMDTSAEGQRPLASARLVYREPAGARSERAQSVSLAAVVTRNAAEAQGSADARVSTMIASHQAAQAQLRAVQMLNEGRAQEAAAVLRTAESSLSHAAAAAPAPMRARIQQQAQRTQQGRARAEGATTPAATRAAALENNDAAYEAEGY